MSNVAIRAALEKRLKTLAPVLPIAWENVNYAPVTGQPYQSVFVLFAEPDDRTWAGNPHLQRGYLQVGLHYPTNQGPGAAQNRAELVRNHFRRGTTLLTDAGFAVVIEKTPEILGGDIEDGRYVVRVRCRFFANLQTEPNAYVPIGPDNQEW